MKKIAIFFLFLLTTVAFAGQDIIIKSRFDLESSEVFIQQLRKFLINNNFGDPYAQRFNDPIVIDLSKKISDSDISIKKGVEELNKIFQIDLLNSNLQLVIEDFAYDIGRFNTEILPIIGESRARGDYVTKNIIHGLKITASGIYFNVVLKTTNQPIVFSIKLIEPEFKVEEELKSLLPINWSTKVDQSGLLLSLEDTDLSHVMKSMVQRPDLVSFKIKDLEIPDFKIQIGQRVVSFPKERFLKFFSNKKDDLKRLVLAALAKKCSETSRKRSESLPQVVNVPKKVDFDSALSGMIDIVRVDMNRAGIMQFDINGDFRSFNQNERNIPRTISEEDFATSVRKMNRSIIESKANISVSLSEDYINKLIEETVAKGFWAKAFEHKRLDLGAKKAFVLADQEGKTFSLYLDLVYYMAKSHRILVGVDKIQFPVKLKISLKIKNQDEIPHLLIDVDEVDTTDEVLLHGIPQYALKSTISNVPRFKNKVLDIVRGELAALEKTTLLDLEVQELKGTYLEELDFSSDGVGRAHATIRFKNKKKDNL